MVESIRIHLREGDKPWRDRDDDEDNDDDASVAWRVAPVGGMPKSETSTGWTTGESHSPQLRVFAYA